ncbi:MAG: hypothetical protein ABH871_02315 [Pseudomonadota bacterium]
MKKHIPSSIILIGIVFVTLVSASIYFVNLVFSRSPSHDNSALSDKYASGANNKIYIFERLRITQSEKKTNSGGQPIRPPLYTTDLLMKRVIKTVVN